MSAAVAERSALPEFIFGDQLLHARFATAIELIANVVLAYPRHVSTSRLAEVLGQSARSLAPILRSLRDAGLIEQAAGASDAWYCASRLSSITLADVFRCVADAPAAPMRSRCFDDDTRSSAQQSVDLLLMQATMAINQVVLQRLQSFDLERLRALGGGFGFESLYARTRLR